MEKTDLRNAELKTAELKNKGNGEAEDLLKMWEAEESIAYIHGWDFSHLDGRYEEEPLPWDYKDEVLRRLKPSMRILDMDTGGGEFLMSLGHPFEKLAATEGYPPNVKLCEETLLPLGIDFRPAESGGKIPFEEMSLGHPFEKLAATEGYPPNVKLCEETLLPLGIDFRPAESGGKIPFEDESFDMVLNRHGSFCPEEIYRVLRPGGILVTQQVGAENDREFVELLLGEDMEMPFPNQYLEITKKAFTEAGFSVTDGREHRGQMRFSDTGALVWFARVLPWEFPDFSAAQCADRLFRAEEILQEQGFLSGTIHRYFLAAEKMGQ